MSTTHKWLIWSGKRWVEDNTGQIYQKAKETAKEMLARAIRITDSDKQTVFAKHAVKTQSEARLRAMINLAQSDLPVVETDLNSNPWLLNVENGTLDLKTGKLRPHKRENLITKLIPVPYEPKATCPNFDAFLQRILGGDQDLIRFMQKVIGYSLTGDTSEQVIFFLHGTGANGKSTLINVILSLLGDYAVQTPTETLLIKRGNSSSNDVARLKGARFVAAVESENGRRLAETLVKQLTGGNKITARFLFREFFEFQPTFKICIAVNHKPTITGSDHAIWRRIRLVPFEVTISPDERDKALGEKLKAELPGILRWAVEGCLLWQREGLELPSSVKKAIDDYRSEMDVVSDFIAECCELVAGAKTPFQELYDRYQDWCVASQEEPMSKTEFARCLTERGFAAGRNSTLGRQRVKIRLGQPFWGDSNTTT